MTIFYPLCKCQFEFRINETFSIFAGLSNIVRGKHTSVNVAVPANVVEQEETQKVCNIVRIHQIAISVLLLKFICKSFVNLMNDYHSIVAQENNDTL